MIHRNTNQIPGRVGRRGGFTFIEVMVVAVVLAILVAMVLPSMSGVADGARLRGSSRSVANLLKVARTEAILGNRVTEVWFDLANHTYRLNLNEPTGETRSERLTSSRTRNKRRNIEQDRALETRVRFDEVQATSPQILEESKVVVRFFPDGSATPTVLTLRNNRGQAMTLEVLRLTGLVETSKGQPKSGEEGEE
jgi:type II secretion system protein H